MDHDESVRIEISDDLAAGQNRIDTVLRERAQRDGDRLLFVDAPDRAERGLGIPRQFTYAGADLAVDRLSRRFHEAGLKEGDIVAIQSPNTVEMPLLILASWRAGLVPCPMPLLWRLDEVHGAFSRIKPAAAVACTQYGSERPAEILGETAAKHMSVRYVFSFGGDAPDGITPLDDVFSAADTEETRVSPHREPATGDLQDTAVITWSVSAQGASPLPHTHGELLALARYFGAELRLRRSDKTLNTYPLFSASALAGQLAAPILAGCQVGLHLPFDFDVFVRQLEDQDITYAAVPAPVITALEERHDLRRGDLKLNRLGCVWPGPHAVKPDPDFPETAIPIFDIYNFAERAVIVRERAPDTDPSLLPLGKIFVPGDEDEEKTEPVVETRVRGSVKKHDSQQVLKGTLTVRGTSVPFRSDIFENTDTAPASQLDAHGFIDTGIGCYVDETLGNQFRCRKSEDVIYHGGSIIAAPELDRLYGEFSEFLDAAAFVLEDAVMGERIFAAVVPRPDQAPSLDRLKAYLDERRVAPHKAPDQLVIVKAIPRTNDGAVVREKILAQL
ncbi:MAG: acyl--CoA ligase [Hyphomicrobiaceae bacterium]|nr:acyl--CoA ligase [Hyphomicrobiaceae bacterium]